MPNCTKYDMDQQKKLLATGFLILAILTVIFLASGISDVEFQPGTISEQEENSPIEFQTKSQAEYQPIWYTLLIILLSIIFPISIVMFIKYPEVRRRTYQGTVYILIYGLLLFVVSGIAEEETELPGVEEELADTSIIATQREAAEFISSVADPDPTLNIILDIAVILLAGLIAFYIYRRFFRKPPSTTDQLRTDAEEAISGIQAGEDLRHVIIRCYADMSQIVNEQRGIQRQKAMTPREFERQLQGFGLPQTAVQRLTRLFEEVRYGNTELGKDAEQEAIHCLTSIIEAC